MPILRQRLYLRSYPLGSLRFRGDNGTVIIRSDGRSTTLRREHVKLEGTGIICVGGTPEDNPEGVVHYTCE